MRFSFALIVLLIIGCGDSSSSSGDGDSMGGATDSGPNQVPFDGDIDPVEPEETVDERSYFPLFNGGEWRYRKKSEEWNMPPPVAEGARTHVVNGEDENEYLRTPVSYLTLGDDNTLVKQTITETFIVEPAVMRVGPVVRFKGIRIEERTAEGMSGCGPLSVRIYRPIVFSPTPGAQENLRPACPSRPMFSR